MEPRRTRAVLVAAGVLIGLGAGAWALGGLRAGSPADPVDVYEAALAALEQGRLDDCRRGLVRLAGLREPTVLDWGVKARLEMAQERTDAAIEALGHVPDSHALGAWARMREGQLEARRKRFRLADLALARAIGLDPNLVEARRERIYVLGHQLRRMDLHREFAALSRLTTLRPKEVWIWCMTRELAWWSPKESQPILEEAISADPEDAWSRLALAENFLRGSQVDKALEAIAPLPEGHPEATAIRVRVAIDLQDLPKAERLLASGPPDAPVLELARGRLALARGRGSEAAAQLERANAAEPGRRGVLSDLARAWVVAGDPAKGRAFAAASGKIDALNSLLLNMETAVDRKDPPRWKTLAAACEAAGRLPEARAWYSLVVAADALDQEAQQAIFRIDGVR